ncbi:MAG: sulfurtransferase TusA family protein [Magnetovibrio sp.]|nr:sulfurtransferase TusA family protein [Magnetovibrio sp.]
MTTPTSTFDLDAISSISTKIDVTGTSHSTPILKLKTALNRASDKDVFGVQVSDKSMEPNIRDFCNGTGNVYIGVQKFDDYDVHYVQKRTIECQRCSNIRAVTMGIIVAGVLTYTAPQVLTSNPSGLVTLLFIGALAALPPVCFNLYGASKKAMHKSNVTMRLEAAE